MKKICVFTGARSEYGLLKPILKKIKEDHELELKLIVSGSHLSNEFGTTMIDIVKDGYNIDEKIEILISSDSAIGISKSIGLAFISLGEAYERLNPDLLIVLGDRYEAFAAASAAMILNIPIAHLSGGDITEGVLDDSFRHCITKMSYLHFPGNEESKKRIIQLGEEENRVFNVGEPGIENIKNMEFYSRDDIETKLNIKIENKYFLIIYHPVTLEKGVSKKYYSDLLNALDEYKNTKIFIKGNADSEGRLINNMLDDYVKNNPENCFSFKSLDLKMYLSLLKNSELLIGNSSSGIVEAPSLNVPSINIGDRQKGRLKAESVIDCLPEKKEIIKKINIALSKEFKEKIKNISNPYGNGDTSEKIIKVIKEFLKKNKINLKKKFYDINFEVKE